MHTSYSICTYSLHFSWYSFFFYFHIFPLESAVVFLISFVLDFHISFFLQNGLFYYISNEMNGFVFLKKMKWYLESNLYDDRFKRKSFLFFFQFIFFIHFRFYLQPFFFILNSFSYPQLFFFIHNRYKCTSNIFNV